MRDITRTVYTFDELTDEAKDRAVGIVQEKLAGSWWDSSDIDDIANEIHLAFALELKTPRSDEYGVADWPGIDGVTLEAWDVDHNDVAFRGILTRDNAPALPWVDELDDVHLIAGRAATNVVSRNGEGEATEDEHAAMIRVVLDALYVAIKAGGDAVDHKTSDETARDWCENNEVQEYEEDGSLA